VPPAEREAIRAELKKRGKPATDEEVAKWYVTGKKLQEQR
jgi:hypothetical protein